MNKNVCRDATVNPIALKSDFKVGIGFGACLIVYGHIEMQLDS